MADTSARSRRSSRKRRVPSRYGFDDPTPPSKKHKAFNTRETLEGNDLLALPMDLWQRIFSQDLSAVSDHFSLQATNRFFHKLANSTETRKNLKLLANGADIKRFLSTETLLPLAKAGNTDAIYLLALMALYVEDDMEVALALMERGCQEGDNQARYELGVLLNRMSLYVGSDEELAYRTIGQDLLAEAASTGHAQSIIEIKPQERNRPGLRSAAEGAMQATRLLQDLVDDKPTPPNWRWCWEQCNNSFCIRGSYRKLTPGVREWLKTKGFSPSWQALRSGVLQCGVTSPYYFPEDPTRAFFKISRCSGCAPGRGEALYCSRACQVLDWRKHRYFCRHLHRRAQG